jgi:DNA-binding transcriptional ArsR family regulator
MPVATSSPRSDRNTSLDRVFRALGDPTRRTIITQLARGDATMTQIAEQFDMSLPGVSKHVAVLEDAGLVERWRTGRSRRCRLLVNEMSHAHQWIADQATFWEDTLENLAAFVEPGTQKP